MQTLPAEIEQIVRVVMQRLAAAGDLAEGVTRIADAADGELTLTEKLVTLQSIEGKLAGKSIVRVPARAVVTPAVIDQLRQSKVKLLREGQPLSTASAPSTKANRNATSVAIGRVAGNVARASDTAQNAVSGSANAFASMAPILVCGSANWFNSLARHLCPKQTSVVGSDDVATVAMINAHFGRGGHRAIWLTTRPFAAAVLASQAGKWPFVQLPSLRELSAALDQAQPRVIIVDANQWTVAAIGNLVRTWVRQR